MSKIQSTHLTHQYFAAKNKIVFCSSGVLIINLFYEIYVLTDLLSCKYSLNLWKRFIFGKKGGNNLISYVKICVMDERYDNTHTQLNYIIVSKIKSFSFIVLWS